MDYPTNPVFDRTAHWVSLINPDGSPFVFTSGAATGAGSTPGASGTQVTPTITNVTSPAPNGTVPAGSRSLTFVFSTDFAGTVLGTAYSGAKDASQPLVPPAGCALAAVPYTVTAGSLRIVDLR